MGKQFRFIMDKTDENKFFHYLSREGRAFEDKHYNMPMEIFEIPNYEWIKIYLYRNEFGNLEYSETPKGIKFINSIDAPVIEFRKTIIRSETKEILRGRLWLEMKYYNRRGEVIQKNKLINEWYKELSKWIQKNLECIELCSGEKAAKEYVSSSLVEYVNGKYKLLG